MLVKLKEALEALARQMKSASFHTSLREGGGEGYGDLASLQLSVLQLPLSLPAP